MTIEKLHRLDLTNKYIWYRLLNGKMYYFLNKVSSLLFFYQNSDEYGNKKSFIQSSIIQKRVMPLRRQVE